MEFHLRWPHGLKEDAPLHIKPVFRSSFFLLLLSCGVAQADREPVLSQIAVPHDYYFREMYLPQLTTGPSAVAFMPDSNTLVYSMQGSLWRQAIDSERAEQLTSGPDYDYQPDVSPDGERIVFARYDGKAVELQVLDLATGEVRALTTAGAVNVEPRWSPDGTRIAYVSTARNGRFSVFVGRFARNGLVASALLDDRRSTVSRYYYSDFDHSLSPVWTPDGRNLLLVRNPETPYGTGSLWLHPVAGGRPTLVRHEETSWKARPDIAPDGRRVVYSSYLGRQWHQLWVTRIGANAEPFPLTYGDYDATSARWSPDGSRIAYIVNEHGNTAIRIQAVTDGAKQDLIVGERAYLVPHGTLSLQLVDDTGAASAGRVSVLAADGRYYAPASHWMHGDDGFDRGVDRVEPHYFHLHGNASIQLPAGAATVTVWRGPENAIEKRTATVDATQDKELTVQLERLDLPDEWQEWQSGDVHVHMNYGGTYRNTPARLVRQAAAEDLDVVFNLIVNKEQRIPDIAYFQPEPDAASNADVLLVHAQEFHTSHWGHQGLLGLRSHLLIPDYVGYPGTAAASLFPDNATIAELARAQGAIVGYVHPFLSPPPDPVNDAKLTHAFPADAALGLVDYYETVGFADHRASAAVWYRLLNCGLRIAAAGGTDAMANYASLRGPLGVNRTYVRLAEPADEPLARRDAWLAALAAGQSFATNAPLLGFSVAGRGPGEEISLASGERTLDYSGFMRSAVPIDHVEVVHNGRVVETIETDRSGRAAEVAGAITVQQSGWLLLRAWNERSHPLIFDLYAYATTTPVWISVDGNIPKSSADADYFLAWIQRLRESAADHPDYNSGAERAAILAHFDAASERFATCRLR